MTVSIDTITERLVEVDEKVQKAVAALESDGGASPVLKAVVEAFQREARHTLEDVEEAEAAPIREHIVELEQAGDSAKCAAEADPGIQPETRQLVVDAHQAISSLKAETKE